MKLFIRRDTVCGNAGFLVLDELGHQKYVVTAEAGAGIRMTMFGKSEEIVSVIKYNTLMLSYFTISCARRFYVLIPSRAGEVSFSIYGSTFLFSGDAASGCFSVLTADGECALSHKKTLSKSGEVFEVIINDEQHELFLLSCALCADSFLFISETDKRACTT